MVRPLPLVFLMTCAVVLIGCGSPKPDTAANPGSGGDSAAAIPAEFVNVKDPIENAFSIDMPKAWKNLAYQARAYDIVRSMVSTVSPDGSTTLFCGDPSMPNYTTPQFSAVEITREVAKVNPLVKIAEYVPAEEYLPDYLQRKFGKLEGFSMGTVEPDPESLEILKQKLAEKGMNMEVSAAKVKFTHNDEGGKRNALIFLNVLHNENMWLVNVAGISTPEDPEKYKDLLFRISKSYTTNPEWSAKEQANHEARMEQIRQQGQMFMQDMANRHQERMKAIQAFGDANMKAYYERSAAMDRNHNNFLNYINDEHTVAASDGTRFQVDNSYQRYYMNKTTGAYVGGDSTTDIDSLRNQGLNPDDYEEVKIVK